MVSKDKLITLLRQAEKSLAEAEEARNQGNTETFSCRIWKTGADLEYFTFIIHLSMENADDSWKDKLKTAKKTDVEADVAELKSLLKEASAAASTSPEEAYRKAWLAREVTLRIQRKLQSPTRRIR